MRVTTVQVRNFRCLRDVEVPLSSPTALVGANGSGKSTFIRALEFFFGEPLDTRDCWGEDDSLEVRVGLVFADIDPGRRAKLEPWLEDDGTLRIEKVCSPGAEDGPATRFVTYRRQHPRFAEVRAEPSRKGILSTYRALRELEECKDLPQVSSSDDARAALAEWEHAHPERLERGEDDAVGLGEIDINTLAELIVVPAVRDASVDATERARGPFGRLAELLISDRSALESNLRELERDLQERYGEAVQLKGDPLLKDAEQTISERLAGLAPGAAVKLSWEQSLPSVNPPHIRSELLEGGFPTEIGRQGHGVQRAYVVAVLQALADLRHTSDGSSEDRPLTLLAIEEPELYQHPVRARFLARVLGRLSQSGDTTQVVYATHSPFFVSLETVECLRLFRQVEAGGEAPQTTVAAVDLDAAADELWRAQDREGDPFTAETLRPRLRAVTESPVAEGFFSSAVVLVEGEEDRAYVIAAARSADVDLEERGIAVLPAAGKSALDRPLVIFRQLRIPTYIIWDGDAHQQKGSGRARPADNRRLLALLGSASVDYPDTQVRDTSACFKNTLADTVRGEIGERPFTTVVDEVATQLDVHKDREKNPAVLAEALTKLQALGHGSPTLRQIVDRVLDLARASTGAGH